MTPIHTALCTASRVFQFIDWFGQGFSTNAEDITIKLRERYEGDKTAYLNTDEHNK